MELDGENELLDEQLDDVDEQLDDENELLDGQLDDVDEQLDDDQHDDLVVQYVVGEALVGGMVHDEQA